MIEKNILIKLVEEEFRPRSIVCFIMDVYYRGGISIRGNEIEASHLCISSCSKYKINSTYNTDFCLMKIRELFHS